MRSSFLGYVVVGFVLSLAVLLGVLWLFGDRQADVPADLQGRWRLALRADATGRITPLDAGPLLVLHADGRAEEEMLGARQSTRYAVEPAGPPQTWHLRFEGDTTAYVVRLFGTDQLELVAPSQGFAQTYMRVLP